MSFSFIDPTAFDRSPLFAALKETCKGAIELGGRAAGAIAEITSSAVAGIGAAAGGFAFGAAALGSSFFDRDSPVPSQAPAKQQAIDVAAPANKYEVPLCELGGFSAPTFGSCSRGGAEIGM